MSARNVSPYRPSSRPQLEEGYDGVIRLERTNPVSSNPRGVYAIPVQNPFAYYNQAGPDDTGSTVTGHSELTARSEISTNPTIQSQAQCTIHCGRPTRKVNVSLIVVMCLFSTLDVIMDLASCIHLRSISGKEPEMALKPPLIGLIFFNAVGVFSYLCETTNLLTSIWLLSGETKVPVVIEQCIVILLEELPLAALHASIATKRQGTTKLQGLACGVAIINSGIRILVYGTDQEWKQQKSKYKLLREGALVAAIFLWVLMAVVDIYVPCVAWYSYP